MRLIKLFLVLSVCVSLNTSAHAIRRSILMDANGVLTDVRQEVEMPYISWAKPYQNGNTKALFIGPMFGHRETVELAQRFSLDYDTVMVPLANSWVLPYTLIEGSSKLDQLLADLRAKVKKSSDCIVIGNIDWDLLPEDVVLEIFEQVSSGKGLIYIMYSQQFPKNLQRLLKAQPAAAQIEQAVPLSAFTGLNDRNGSPILNFMPNASYYTFGKGRVLLLSYPGCQSEGVHYLTPDPYDRLAYEYCQSYLIKNILWAAQKQSALQIVCVETPQNVSLAQLESEQIKVAYKTTLPQQDLSKAKAVLKITDKNLNELFQCEKSLDGSEAVSFNMPQLPYGKCFANVHVTLDGKVLDWSSTCIDVYSPNWISGIELLYDCLEPTDILSGNVLVSKMPELSRLEVSVRDNYGRIYGQVSLPDPNFATQVYATNKSYNWFRIPISGSMTTINIIRAELKVGDNVLSSFEREFYIPQPIADDFLVGIWGLGERLQRASYISSLVSSRAKQLGVGMELLGHYYNRPQGMLNITADVTRCNIAAYPYVDRMNYFGSDRVRNPCLTDPNYLTFTRKKMQNWAAQLKKFGCMGYNLGDENHLTAGAEVCISSTCLKGYQSWLKEQYKNLDSLNEEWNTDYSEWDKIVPPIRQEAEKLGNLAPWVDHKLFMTEVAMNYMSQVSSYIKQSDPAAICGPEGIWGSSPNFGFDWQQAVDKFDILIPYYNEPAAFASTRSLAKKSTLTGIWCGGYPPRSMHENMARYDVWRAVLNSMKTVWFYSWYDGTLVQHANYLAIGPDFRLNRSGKWFFDEAGIIQNGIGKLILNSKRGNNGIALYYSQPSSYITGVTATNNLIYLLQDAGISFDIVTSKGVKSNILRNFRCLILPHCVALSEQECTIIKEFVQNGGVVVADIVPAIYDEHGKKLPKSQLADIFGLAGNSKQAMNENSGDVIPEMAEIDLGLTQTNQKKAVSNVDDDYGLVIGKVDFVSAVQFTENFKNKKLGGIHNVGSGKAVFLNFTLEDYEEDRELCKSAKAGQLLRDILVEAGIKPEISVVYPDAKQCMQGVQVINYDFAGGSLIAVFRDEPTVGDSSPVQINVAIPAAKHLYEFETGDYLGRQTKFSGMLNCGRPLIVFALNNQAGKLEVLAPASVKAGDVIVANISIPLLDQSVCHITLTDPDGMEAGHYSRNCFLNGGKANVIQRTALNEKKGIWNLTVADVVTSQKVDLQISVD